MGLRLLIRRSESGVRFRALEERVKGGSVAARSALPEIFIVAGEIQPFYSNIYIEREREEREREREGERGGGV